jgi:hypothetical protein
MREDAVSDREQSEARIAARESASGLYRVGGMPVFEDVRAAGERRLWGWARGLHQFMATTEWRPSST